MSIKHDPSGHRSIQAEAEVPGSPEEVWEAIATGPGISSWFYPTDVEERVGGTLRYHTDSQMDHVPGEGDRVGRAAPFPSRGQGLRRGGAADGHRVDHRGAHRRALPRPRGAQPLRQH